MMKKSEILWESPKCDTETWSEQVLLKNDNNRFVQQTFNLLKKKKKKLHLLKQSMIKQGIPVFVPLASSFPKYTQ